MEKNKQPEEDAASGDTESPRLAAQGSTDSSAPTHGSRGSRLPGAGAAPAALRCGSERGGAGEDREEGECR